MRHYWYWPVSVRAAWPSFLSDQFWLWARGFKGGGPQAALLKRTAHWLVGEPELDETALRVHSEVTDNGWQLVITKQVCTKTART